VALGAAGFAAVDRWRGVVARFVVVDRLEARLLVDVCAVAEAFGVAAAAGAVPAAATGAEVGALAFAAEAFLLRGVVDRFLVAARGLADAAVERDGPRALRPRMPSISAASSAISSRTSARRDVRLSRLFFVAFSRRAARQVSSERAATRANSSHSTWRASAAAGVMAATATVARRVLARGAASAAEDLLPDLVVPSVISSPSWLLPGPFSPKMRRGAMVREPLATR
jgi:hypothetical protein